MVEHRPYCGIAEAVENVKVAPKIWRLTLYTPEIATAAKPGQFVNIRASRQHDPLLRRPFSLNRIDRAKGTISVLYRVVGRGTELISLFRLGEKVDLIGPLGKGFATSHPRQNSLFVAGGMGIAPLFPLAQELRADKADVTCLYGVRCADDLAEVSHLETIGVKVVTASEDGCGHYHGQVTDLLAATLCQEDFSLGFACGPHAMLSATKDLCLAAKLPLQVSLESIMACGLGLCLGCTCPKSNGEDYWHICTDGPVLWAEEVDFAWKR